jgi:hypothetical protein
LLHNSQTKRYKYSVNDQRDAQIISMYLFIFLTLYMFRAHRAYHQVRQTLTNDIKSHTYTTTHHDFIILLNFTIRNASLLKYNFVIYITHLFSE